MDFWKKVSLRKKITGIVFILVFFSFTINTLLSVNQLTKTMSKDLVREMKGTAILTAMHLDGQDVSDLSKVKGEKNPNFMEIQKRLDKLQQEQGTISWIYIWEMKNNQIRTTGFTSNLNEIYKPGAVFEDVADIHKKAAEKAISTEKPQVTENFKDSYGEWRTAFVPLKDKSGAITSVLAIDYSANFIKENIIKNVINQIVIAIVELFIVLGILFFLIRQIFKPVVSVVEIAEKIAKGNLEETNLIIKNEDEVGKLQQSIGIMTHNLRNMIINIRGTSDHLASLSEEMSANVSESAERTIKLTGNLQQVTTGAHNSLNIMEETSKAIHDSSQGIQSIAESASSVSESSAETSQEAQQGNEIIQKLMKQMVVIEDSVENISSKVQQLNENSLQINNIVNIITEIADQTNLLALNAAIEAARAGEHGKGFAVVASEVKKLAEQSGNSAGQIKELLQIIQTDSQQSVEAMQTGITQLEVGMRYTNETGEVFEQILHSTGQVASQIQEVSASTEQLSAFSEEINASIQEMKEVSNQSSKFAQQVTKEQESQLASIEELKAATESLETTAEELQVMINNFKL